MITCTKSMRIEAGHRLKNHESKCKNVHGHSYQFDVTVVANELDNVGRVVDFGVIKETVGKWLENDLDHAFIFEDGDPIGDFLAAQEQKIYRISKPPTAENLAKMVFQTAVAILPKHLAVVSVVCHETSTCKAEYSSKGL